MATTISTLFEVTGRYLKDIGTTRRMFVIANSRADAITYFLANVDDDDYTKHIDVRTICKEADIKNAWNK